jgi:F-type H+-transporting ATPase subunit b|tara:strand:- start:3114 stop:3704 length:591 start_codon:yes stop_codon:yes gene_type:complete
MLLRLFGHLIFLNFLLTSLVESSESGGMPQLNPEFWFSQIFWLIITFGVLFIVLSKLILPKISANLEARKSQILENIGAAEKQREASENKIKEYEKIILDSKNEAKNYFNKARGQILKDIDKKRKTLKNEINVEIKKAEKEIVDLKNKSPEKINKIVVETSSDLVKQLIGVEVNNSSISAIVEDISKKVKEKNYGI